MADRRFRPPEQRRDHRIGILVSSDELRDWVMIATAHDEGNLSRMIRRYVAEGLAREASPPRRPRGRLTSTEGR